MICILRHGETAKNRASLLQGRSNEPLNERGTAQAAAVRDWFQSQGITFDLVLSSPLLRAVRTAELAAPGLPVRMEERLIEMDYGPYEGMDLRHPAPEVLTFFADFVHNPAPEGMEPLEAVTARLGSLLEELKETAVHRNILLATHAIAMKGALEYLTPESHGGYWSKHIGNCAVYTAEVRNGAYTVPVEVFSLPLN